MDKLLNIGVLVSGSGTNLQSIIDACANGTVKGRVACVISNKADAYALKRAEAAGIPAIHIDHTQFEGRRSYDAAVVEVLRRHGVELVALAGFMRIITQVLLDAFPMAVMNIHPALLPAFPGLHAQRQTLEYGAKLGGCTVHFVDAGTDTGPIILQAAVPVQDDDTEDTLAARILKEEHRLYPEAIRLFSEGKLKVEGRRVYVR
ncbi:phosphoribosylglycinamide formyltransferase [Geomesophilobacter sediminis]|uniref:Phosphoribosylglycinamide formyltransferase n=1 Tax=Geomesophilobacter sediminis TaxID=2798584 RepID=A0A8J7JDY1_9BACT|nr:phosphoribosylglycinamide formyltransferase [Geomesophilobacter sediminis]MBJ6723999.1 phosphoribosylglycinamide formyltransferase [Geomesophilobacter sediminis]